MGRILAVLLVGSAGCAQLAGIEETSGLPPGVSLTLDRMSIGSTVTRGPLDLTGLAATYLVPDEAEADGLARVPAELVDINVWSAPIYDGTPAVMFPLPGRTDPRIWALPNRDLAGVYAVYEHPAPMPPPAAAMLTVGAALPTGYNGTETFQLFTVGTWTRKALPAPAAVDATVLGPFGYDYSTSTSLVGRPLEAITTEDTSLVLRYQANKLTGVLEATPFDQTGTDTIDGTMVAVPHDQTLDVVLDPPGTPMRFAGSMPALTTFTMSWGLRASPGYSFAAELGPGLEGGALDDASPAALTLTYGNPFLARDWATTFKFGAVGSRIYVEPVSTLSIELQGSISQVIDVAAAGPGAAIDMPVGVPELISIDGVALVTDGTSITKPVLSPTVTFTASRADNTLYEIVLIEITPDMAGTALTKRVVITIANTEPTFVIPAELLESGKLYTIRAQAVGGGYTTSADGDLTNRSLPLSHAFFESGVFTVTP